MSKNKMTYLEKNRKSSLRHLKKRSGDLKQNISTQDPELIALQKLVGNRGTQDVINKHHAQQTQLDFGQVKNRQRGGLLTSIQLQTAKKTLPTTPLLEAISKRLPQWFLKPSKPGTYGQNPNLRKILLTLYARIGDSLWKELIPEGSITHVSEMGDLDFVTNNRGLAYFALYNKGYRATIFSKGSEDDWGLYEPTLPAAGLHVRGKKGKGNKINIHIDLHPPSWNIISHVIWDSDYVLSRKGTHTPETLQEGVEKLGIDIPILYEQKVHGMITSRFNRLASQVKGRTELQTEIDEGRQYLAQAGKIIWNKDILKNTDLKNATLYLMLASGCAWEVEHFLKRKP